jgi:hypothetical protein
MMAANNNIEANTTHTTRRSPRKGAAPVQKTEGGCTKSTRNQAAVSNLVGIVFMIYLSFMKI